MCPVSEEGIRDGTFWETRPRGRVGTGLQDTAGQQALGRMYGGGQSVVQDPTCWTGPSGSQDVQQLQTQCLYLDMVRPYPGRKLPPQGSAQGPEPQGSSSTRLLWAAAAAVWGPAVPCWPQPPRLAQPPGRLCIPAAGPLRPKRAGKWGGPPQPAPVACPEWRPYSTASQEPTASFELGGASR